MATRIKKQSEEYEEIKPIPEEETPNKDIKPEQTIDTEIEFLRYLGQVKSRLKKEITEDFIFASLEERDKEAVIEMSTTAYYTLRTYQLIIDHYKEWHWNPNLERWEEKRINKDKTKILESMQNGAFDAFMTRVLMTVIMNRNKAGNPIVELLASKGQAQKEDNEEAIKLIEKIKNDAKKGEDTR